MFLSKRYYENPNTKLNKLINTYDTEKLKTKENFPSLLFLKKIMDLTVFPLFKFIFIYINMYQY